MHSPMNSPSVGLFVHGNVEDVIVANERLFGHGNDGAMVTIGEPNFGDGPNMREWPAHTCSSMKTCAIAHGSLKMATPIIRHENMGDGPNR